MRVYLELYSTMEAQHFKTTNFEAPDNDHICQKNVVQQWREK
jgi:hypothetical protein